MTWPIKTLGEVATWGSGGTPKRSTAEFFGDGVPWLSIADLNDDVVTEAKESLTTVGIQNSSAKVVPRGTILVAMYGSIGKLGVAGMELCTSQAIAFARPYPELIETRYLFHFLLAERPRLQRRGRGGTQMNISQGDLKAWPIALPPLDEQRRVAAILDQADVLRSKRRQALACLDDLSRSTFIDMFGDPLENPVGYRVEVLADWVEQDRPITYGILKPGPHVPDGVPYVRVADMRDRGIAVHGVRRTTEGIAKEYRRSRLQVGDLLMSIRGHVGRCAFVPEELDGANITQDSARLAVSDPDRAQYVRAAIESPGIQHWMARRTKGAAVTGINLGDLRTLPLPLPPGDQLRRFARLARCVEQQRVVMRAMAGPVDQLFDSLQSQAFRGDL